MHSLNRTYGQKSSELIVDNSSQQIQKEVKSCKKEKSTINFKAWRAVLFFSWPATRIGDTIVETLLYSNRVTSENKWHISPLPSILVRTAARHCMEVIREEKLLFSPSEASKTSEIPLSEVSQLILSPIVGSLIGERAA